jgi:hypothetical protein
MHSKSLHYLLVALIFFLWAGQPIQAQSAAERSPKKKTCGDLWPVQQGKKWGYIDRTGKLVISYTFSFAQEFSEGLACVETKVKSGYKYGYIDQTGKFVIPPQFYWGNPFSEGLAIAVMRRLEKGKIMISRFGYIDKSGCMVIRPQHVESEKYLSKFSEGLACLMQENGKIGYIDKTGKMVIPAQYSNAHPFSEGLAAVTVENKYGYIDTSGKMVIPPQFDNVGPFSEGLAYVESDGNKGFIDKSGKLVIKGEEFLEARGFSEGLAAVWGKNQKFGYIDKTGAFAIQPQFDRVGDFSEGLAAVQPDRQASWPGNLSYINQKGEIVIKSMSTLPDRTGRADSDLSYYRFCGEVARVGLGIKENTDAEGYIDTEGKFIWPEGITSGKKMEK